jgi:hypothetical protein
MKIMYISETRNRDNSVVQRWATGWMFGGSNPGRGWEFFSSPPHPDQVWNPPIFLSNGYQGLFHWKLTTHLHLVLRSRSVELYIHSANTPPWRDAQFKKGTGTTLLLALARGLNPLFSPKHVSWCTERNKVVLTRHWIEIIKAKRCDVTYVLPDDITSPQWRSIAVIVCINGYQDAE